MPSKTEIWSDSNRNWYQHRQKWETETSCLPINLEEEGEEEDALAVYCMRERNGERSSGFVSVREVLDILSWDLLLLLH